jgi:hypothetical protein
MSLSRCSGFLLRSLIISALAVFMASGTVQAQQVPLRQYEPIFNQMLNAIQSRSYDRFVANGDARFRSGFTEKMFEELAQRLGPRLQQGYSAPFLTTLHQQDYMVYVWKLAFKDGKDDFLVTLFIKNGNISGFMTR